MKKILLLLLLLLLPIALASDGELYTPVSGDEEAYVSDVGDLELNEFLSFSLIYVVQSSGISELVGFFVIIAVALIPLFIILAKLGDIVAADKNLGGIALIVIGVLVMIALFGLSAAVTTIFS